MEENNIKRCPHCGGPLSWHGDYEEIELDGGEFVAFDAIEVCDNPDCDEFEGLEDDDEIKALEAAAFGGHGDVWIDVDGEQVRVLADVNMSPESTQALTALIRAAREAITNGDIDDGDGLRLCSVCRQYECQAPATKCWRCREQEIIDGS